MMTKIRRRHVCAKIEEWYMGRAVQQDGRASVWQRTKYTHHSVYWSGVVGMGELKERCPNGLCRLDVNLYA